LAIITSFLFDLRIDVDIYNDTTDQQRDLKRFVAGADVFSRQTDGTTIAGQYAKQGIALRPANTDRVNGWAEIMTRFGDVEATKAREVKVRKLRGL
jgi:hypothetical protein